MQHRGLFPFAWGTSHPAAGGGNEGPFWATSHHVVGVRTIPPRSEMPVTEPGRQWNADLTKMPIDDTDDSR